MNYVFRFFSCDDTYWTKIGPLGSSCVVKKKSSSHDTCRLGGPTGYWCFPLMICTCKTNLEFQPFPYPSVSLLLFYIQLMFKKTHEALNILKNYESFPQILQSSHFHKNNLKNDKKTPLSHFSNFLFNKLFKQNDQV